MSEWLSQFLDSKCINLETYRKDGMPVQTPVWFVIENNTLYVTTPPTTGKVRRLKNNKNVRLVPCNMRGTPKGMWIDATAYFADDAESKQAISLRKKKYGMMARLIGLAVYRKGTPVVIGITPKPAA